MKTLAPILLYPLKLRVLGVLLFLFPNLLFAHPGHYHPGEDDEFYLLKSTILHSHGVFDYVLLGIVLCCAAMVFLAKNPAYRIGAFAGGVVSLLLISVH
jgi:hypothetical protein